jgi:hypothetical protein
MTARPPATGDCDGAERAESVSAYMADQLCRGFIYHDRREREAAVEAFAAVDTLQFAHLDASTAREAAEGYVDALWAKDAVENACRDENGDIDPDRLAEADWSAVEDGFRARAEAADIDAEYARLTTVAWREHKCGGDYWSPMMHAQMLELRAALQDEAYPHKPRHGQAGFGPEPTRYALGNELHDTRQWTQAREVMTPYFRRIVEERADEMSAVARAVIPEPEPYPLDAD